MDPRFQVTREEFHNVQMDVKQVQFIQQSHADRLLRLEKRQADDAALKSVWNSPFPSVLGGTPQHGLSTPFCRLSTHQCTLLTGSRAGPVQMPSNDVFDDLDEQGQNLLSSLHIEADDEPIRRGAASRANSVRFDESALQGSSWGGQGTRQSGEFGPIRPSSGLGSHPMMERSLSHKSDGRHSSAGHSVHSVHSVASGRASSSLGLDTNFLVGGPEDEFPLDIPEPPPGFFVLGSVPSIVRCWLTTNFAHNTLLYAAVCTGSQKSTVNYSLVKELGLLDDTHRDLDGARRIRLTVYLVEARVAQPSTRSPSLAPQIPSINATFEVTGVEQSDSDIQRGIRIFIGSDTLRIHSADVLFSQNLMTLYSHDRDKLSVPFVRPEDDAIFKHLSTTNVVPDRPKLSASAPEFVADLKGAPQARGQDTEGTGEAMIQDSQETLSPEEIQLDSVVKGDMPSNGSESGTDSDRLLKDPAELEPSGKENVSGSEGGRRESATGIWASWRQSGSVNGGEGRENGPLSGYQPAGRGTRNMKVLKPIKSGSSTSARTGASYEPAPPPRSSGEYRRKSHAAGSTSGENGSVSGTGSTASSSVRWEARRSLSNSTVGAAGSSSASGGDKTQPLTRDVRNAAPPPRSANPVGGASAFSWMTPTSKPKTPGTAAGE